MQERKKGKKKRYVSEIFVYQKIVCYILCGFVIQGGYKNLNRHNYKLEMSDLYDSATEEPRRVVESEDELVLHVERNGSMRVMDGMVIACM